MSEQIVVKTKVTRFVNTIKINLAATLVAVFLLVLFGDGRSLYQISILVIISFIHSNCIGCFTAISLPFLSLKFNQLRFPLNWVLLISGLVALSILGCFVAGLILVGIKVYGSNEYWKYFLVCVRIAILVGLGFGISIFIYHNLELKLAEKELELRTKELEKERTLKLATQARLSMLEAQIHPHFLFNTLNSISSLIQDDPPLAERLVERLAALLRFSLDANNNSLVPLQQELKIVIDYLEIEKTRFADRLQYNIDIPNNMLAFYVPPLSIQTIVENSVKYAVSPKKSGAKIDIKAQLIDEKISIEIQDNGPGFNLENLIPGHGLDNLRARLQALFGNEAFLNISNVENYTTVRVLLPAKKV